MRQLQFFLSHSSENTSNQLWADLGNPVACLWFLTAPAIINCYQERALAFWNRANLDVLFRLFTLPELGNSACLLKQTNKQCLAEHYQVDFLALCFQGRDGSLCAEALLSQTITHIIILRITDGTPNVWEWSRQIKNQGEQMQSKTDVERERKMITKSSWWNRDWDKKRKKRTASGFRWIQTVRSSGAILRALRLGWGSFTAVPLGALSKTVSAFWIQFSRFSALSEGLGLWDAWKIYKSWPLISRLHSGSQFYFMHLRFIYL